MSEMYLIKWFGTILFGVAFIMLTCGCIAIMYEASKEIENNGHGS